MIQWVDKKFQIIIYKMLQYKKLINKSINLSNKEKSSNQIWPLSFNKKKQFFHNFKKFKINIRQKKLVFQAQQTKYKMISNKQMEKYKYLKQKSMHQTPRYR